MKSPLLRHRLLRQLQGTLLGRVRLGGRFRRIPRERAVRPRPHDGQLVLLLRLRKEYPRTVHVRLHYGGQIRFHQRLIAPASLRRAAPLGDSSRCMPN